MCFRPAGAAKGATCPQCNKKIQFIGGVVQKKCPFCGAALDPGNAAQQKEQKDS